MAFKKSLAGLLILFALACNNNDKPDNTATENQQLDSSEHAENKVVSGNDTHPAPDTTKSVTKRSDVIGWKNGKMPAAPQGFTVAKFAGDLAHPRWIYVAQNGDVFVSQGDKEKSPNNILLFRDANKDGVAESKTVFLRGLNMLFGMLILGNKFYVANTDAVVVYDYTPGATSITAQGKKIISLPAGPRHWTRNIIANRGGSKIYIAVGSSSNVGENGMDKEAKRADIIEINPDGSGNTVPGTGQSSQGIKWCLFRSAAVTLPASRKIS